MAQNRKNEILHAACQCFLKFGYDKTTLDDIGLSVGMNKVSLYYYFKNKEAIFSELILSEADECCEYLENKVKAIPDYKEKIITWIEEGLKYKNNNSILQQLSIESIKKLGPQLYYLKEYAKNKGIEYLEGIFSELKSRNEIIECDVKRIAVIIQDIIYSMKDYYYQQIKSSPMDSTDVNFILQNIVFSVSLILDGLMMSPLNH